MFLLKWIRFFRGYLTIFITGSFPERFLNLAARKGIDFWNVRHVEGGITMRLRKSHFKRLKAIAKNASCRVHIVQKEGAPFVAHRYRKRTGLFFGAIAVFVLMAVLSQFVWSVSILADEGIEVETVRQGLAENGLKPGTLKSSLRSEEIKNQMMLENQDIAFIGINVKGVKAEVEVRARKQKPDDLSGGVPCNVVAAKDGQILRVDAIQGKTVVQDNQFVRQGELIISGVIDSVPVGARYVHADGAVYAKTWHTLSVDIPLTETVRNPTGRTKNLYSLYLFGWRLNLYGKGGISYETYDTITENRMLGIPNGPTAPLGIIKDQLIEISPEERELTYDEALQRGTEQLRAQVLEQNPGAEILDEVRTAQEVDGTLRVSVEFTCKEQIAKQEAIDVDTEVYRWLNE